MSKETALELDAAAAGYTGSEPVHFGDFPGVWEPGQPIAVSELGFATEKDALDEVAALELPLLEVQVDAGSAPMPARPNHLIDTSQQDVLEREREQAPRPRTHEQVDQMAADAGVVFPDDVTTVAEKLAHLDALAEGAEG